MRRRRLSIFQKKTTEQLSAFDLRPKLSQPSSFSKNKNSNEGSEFIDQMYNLDYKISDSCTTQVNCQRQDQFDDLNYFDEIIFQKSNSTENAPKNVTIGEIEDFNYIDSVYFKSSAVNEFNKITPVRRSFQITPNRKLLKAFKSVYPLIKRF